MASRPSKRWHPPNDAASRAAALVGTEPKVLTTLSTCWPCFEDLPTPRSGAWLAKGEGGERDRVGQTMKVYTRPGPHRSFPTLRAKTILLVPLGDVGAAPPAEVLMASLQATFFGMTVAVAPSKLLPKKEVKNLSCQDFGGEYGPQYVTDEIHELLARHKPRDSFVVVAYTMVDITKRDGTGGIWNFVFGEACQSRGTGIFSFARYAEGTGSMEESAFKRRCCMVLNHEVGHLFGIKHCIYAQCLMNGSNSLKEAEKRPFALCPIDLAKIFDTLTRSGLMPPTGQHALRVTFLVEREAALLAFFEREGMESDAALARRRLALIKESPLPVVPPLSS